VTSWAVFSRTPSGLRRLATPRVLYVVVALVYATFVISTIPGVRPRPGYNLFLDGILNNIAYELSAVVCFVRARNALSYRRSWRWFGVGLALYGAGNIYWTIFIRI
jgi:diguanylate cyclase